MQLQEIYNQLDSISPFDLQEAWDNSGLQIGSLSNEITNIYLSLDIDSNLLENLKPNSLIITHHPLIFKGIKAINCDIYPSSLIKTLVQKNISLIAMHTNFDKTHLNKYVAKNILGFEILKEEDFCIYLKIEKSFDDLSFHIKQALNINHLRVVKTKDYIKTAVLTTGSGGDLMDVITADCFLTGDIKYHQALEAKENNLSIIDICHFESERYFPEAIENDLKNLNLKIEKINSINPFEYK